MYGGENHMNFGICFPPNIERAILGIVATRDKRVACGAFRYPKAAKEIIGRAARAFQQKHDHRLYEGLLVRTGVVRTTYERWAEQYGA